jgi:hypothetical protein
VAARGVDDALVVADLVEQRGANRNEPTLGIAVKNLDVANNASSD